jgi:ATP-dependent Lon protease
VTRKTTEFQGAEGEEILKRRVGAMFGFLAAIYGPEKLVLKAGKLGALKGMKSQDLLQQIVALQKVVYEDPTIQASPEIHEITAILEDCQEEIADRIARQSVEQ